MLAAELRLSNVVFHARDFGLEPGDRFLHRCDIRFARSHAIASIRHAMLVRLILAALLAELAIDLRESLERLLFIRPRDPVMRAPNDPERDHRRADGSRRVIEDRRTLAVAVAIRPRLA